MFLAVLGLGCAMLGSVRASDNPFENFEVDQYAVYQVDGEIGVNGQSIAGTIRYAVTAKTRQSITFIVTTEIAALDEDGDPKDAVLED